MMRLALTLGCTLLSATAVQAQPATAPASCAASRAAAPRSVSAIFARAYLPDQMIVENFVTSAVAGFRRQVGETRIAEVNRETPGMFDAVLATYRRNMTQCMLQQMPTVQRDVAERAATHFTDSELGALTHFYRSSTGRAYLAAAIATGPTSNRDLVLRRMTAAQQRQLLAFQASPVGRKEQSVGQDMIRTTANALMNAYGSIAPVVDAAVTRETNRLAPRRTPPPPTEDVDPSLVITPPAPRDRTNPAPH